MNERANVVLPMSSDLLGSSIEPVWSGFKDGTRAKCQPCEGHFEYHFLGLWRCIFDEKNNCFVFLQWELNFKENIKQDKKCYHRFEFSGEIVNSSSELNSENININCNLENVFVSGKDQSNWQRVFY